jgi:hypothetical protein
MNRHERRKQAVDALEQASQLVHEAALAAHVDDEWSVDLDDAAGAIESAISEVKATK